MVAENGNLFVGGKMVIMSSQYYVDILSKFPKKNSDIDKFRQISLKSKAGLGSQVESQTWRRQGRSAGFDNYRGNILRG